ncbi:hypothetical protein [Ulvibacter litoralis]|uniref:Uncharacterized protein n=1 Tax=Ulvibacter litoralis TaxID=227084 RepID=A0A1G7EP23_9FLAO|nr:hypothetical protein [Ulvibacter litoralis]GHC54478.1 hypothetical protein GCM10008083_18390 [Ulvibacter litoralis]SDE65135.1 hypothetical protein SAMN05421855_10260 [Ulvibacter litoralis]
MKSVLILLIAFFPFTNYQPKKEVKTYDLATAIEQKLVEYNVTGNSESPHYYEPIRITLKNKSNAALQIRIPNGQKFESVSPDIQDVITTQEELIALSEEKTITKPLLGMCIQQHNSAPSSKEAYKLGGLATGHLAKLTQEIQTKEAFTINAQYAIWSLDDPDNLYAIDGFDQEEALHFQSFTANLLGVSLEQDPFNEYDAIDNNEEDSNYDNRYLVKRKVGGKFKYKFSKTSAVTIGMFNDQDIVVKELYNNPETKPGEHFLSYEFDTNAYTDDVYYIRLIINGQIKINYEMKSKRS